MAQKIGGNHHKLNPSQAARTSSWGKKRENHQAGNKTPFEPPKDIRKPPAKGNDGSGNLERLKTKQISIPSPHTCCLKTNNHRLKPSLKLDLPSNFRRCPKSLQIQKTCPKKTFKSKRRPPLSHFFRRLFSPKIPWSASKIWAESCRTSSAVLGKTPHQEPPVSRLLWMEVLHKRSRFPTKKHSFGGLGKRSNIIPTKGLRIVRSLEKMKKKTM